MGCKATDKLRAAYADREHELYRMFKQGERDPLYVLDGLQMLIDGKAYEIVSPPAQAAGFDRYKPYLMSLEDQRDRLADFNNRFWKDSEVDAWLNMAGDGSDHVQSVEDLEILYVDFGSPEKNVEMWWKVISGTQPNAWRWEGLLTDPEHLRLGHNTRQYEPGIHRVRINLAAHWEPESGRSVRRVRDQAAGNGETLAAAEVLAAYGLHDELLRQQDGQNMPYADLAGFEASVSGSGPWTCCPYLFWYRDDREVSLSAGRDDDVYCDWAAPVLREL